VSFYCNNSDKLRSQLTILTPPRVINQLGERILLLLLWAFAIPICVRIISSLTSLGFLTHKSETLNSSCWAYQLGGAATTHAMAKGFTSIQLVLNGSPVWWSFCVDYCSYAHVVAVGLFTSIHGFRCFTFSTSGFFLLFLTMRSRIRVRTAISDLSNAYCRHCRPRVNLVL